MAVQVVSLTIKDIFYFVSKLKLNFSPSPLDSQVAVEPKDFGSTSSLALLHLFTSPSLNQPALLTGVSSRRKQTHLFGLQTQRKLKKLINLDHLTSLLLSTPLCCTGFYSLGQMDKPRQSGQIPRRKTFEN